MTSPCSPLSFTMRTEWFLFTCILHAWRLLQISRHAHEYKELINKWSPYQCSLNNPVFLAVLYWLRFCLCIPKKGRLTLSQSSSHQQSFSSKSPSVHCGLYTSSCNANLLMFSSKCLDLRFNQSFFIPLFCMKRTRSGPRPSYRQDEECFVQSFCV